jgi:hypothetical protein
LDYLSGIERQTNQKRSKGQLFLIKIIFFIFFSQLSCHWVDFSLHPVIFGDSKKLSRQQGVQKSESHRVQI